MTEESQNEEGRFLDLDKYEGHTEGPWNGKAKNPRIHAIMASGDGKMVGIYYGTVKVEREDPNEDPYESIRAITNYEWTDWARADASLIADAPLLLAEVERLQKKIDKANEAMLSAKRLLKYHYDIFCNFTHTTDLQDEAILDAIQALSDASE